MWNANPDLTIALAAAHRSRLLDEAARERMVRGHRPTRTTLRWTIWVDRTGLVLIALGERLRRKHAAAMDTSAGPRRALAR